MSTLSLRSNPSVQGICQRKIADNASAKARLSFWSDCSAKTENFSSVLYPRAVEAAAVTDSLGKIAEESARRREIAAIWLKYRPPPTAHWRNPWW